MKPIVGIFPSRKDKPGADYLAKLKTAGAEAVVLPVSEFREPVLKALRKVRGILLPGGGDFTEEHYENFTQKKAGTLREVDPVRERAEWLALDFARENRLPVFGICRGFQVINLHAGGTLMADMELELAGAGFAEHRTPKGNARQPDHDVGFDPGTALGRLASLSSAGVREEKRIWLRVNNSHHQAILKLGKGLRVAATARDGIIEAIESDDSDMPFQFGVQFHPEKMACDFSRRLFELFVKTVRNS